MALKWQWGSSKVHVTWGNYLKVWISSLDDGNVLKLVLMMTSELCG
jgi:hypothetical protein